MTAKNAALALFYAMLVFAMPAYAQEPLAVQFLKQYLEPETKLIYDDQVAILRREVDLVESIYLGLPLLSSELSANYNEPLALEPNPETDIDLLLAAKGILNVRVNQLKIISSKAIALQVSPLMASLWVSSVKLVPGVAEIVFEQKIGDSNELQVRTLRIYMAVYQFFGKQNFSIVYGHTIRSVDLVDRVVFNSGFSEDELSLLMTGLVSEVISPKLNLSLH
jgi:hypothetical protein